MTFFKLNRAIMWNEDGQLISIPYFPRWAKRFRWRGGSYIVDTNASKFTKTNWLYSTTYYQYDINNSFPLELKTDIKPKYYETNASAQIFDSLIESSLARQLNQSSKKGLSEYLTPMNILMGVGAIILIIVIMARGGLS